MELLPKEIADTLPAIYATQIDRDPVAHVRLYVPGGKWTWYVMEYCAVNRLAYGYVVGECHGFCYFSVAALEKALDAWEFPVTRDLNWTPRRLSRIQEEHRTQGGTL